MTPYLNTSINRRGDKISVERKSGRSPYTRKHLDEAVRHAIENGANYSMIVYDTQDNIPQTMKTKITREKDVLVAVVDIESGTWKMAREIFEILQAEMMLNKKTVNEINIKTIHEVAKDIGVIAEYAKNIKSKAAKLATLKEEIDQGVDEITDAVNTYRSKLIALIAQVEKMEACRS